MKKIFFLFPFILLSCSKNRLIEKKYTFFPLHTVVNITLVDSDINKIKRGKRIVEDEFRRVERKFGIFNKESEIFLINRFAGIKPVKVSSEVIKLIKFSIEFSRKTSGMFDIAIAPLEFLWGFYEGYEKKVPNKKELEKVLKLVNYKNIVIDENKGTVFLKKKGMEIDLSSFIKGYAVDKVIEKLKKVGLKGCLVEAGGDLRFFGRNLRGRKWRIGIRHPRRLNEIYKIIELDDRAVATSGDYENYFVKNGERYHHILNPETGYPVKDIVSVTVVAKDCITADLLSTAIFVLGKEKGLRLANKMENVDALIVYEEGGKLKRVCSKNFNRFTF